MHGPGHSSEECKVLKVYSEKYVTQRPHQSTEARSGGNPKHGKFVKFDDNTKEANVIQNDDIHILRKKKGTKLATKESKIKIVKSAAAKKGRTYCMFEMDSSLSA